MASQKTPYLFLYARAYEDVKLVLAGWEATLLWPHVLCLLKQRGGVFDDDESSPEFVAATLRCPVEIASAGMAGLKRAGLLVDGSRRCPGGAGGSHERTGWVTPSWDKWAVDRRERGEGRAKTTVTRPLPDRSRALPTVTPDNGELELERELEENNPPNPRRRGGAVSAEDQKAWDSLRALRPRLSANVPKTGRREFQRAVSDVGADGLALVFQWAHKSPHTKAAFLREHNGGKPSWATLCRKAAEYLEFAEDEYGGAEPLADPDAYETPDGGDYIAIAGKRVFRRPTGVWLPNAGALMDKTLPWRTDLQQLAARLASDNGADGYLRGPWIDLLTAHRFPAEADDRSLTFVVDDLYGRAKEARHLELQNG